MDTELALLAGRGDSGLAPAPGAQARLATAARLAAAAGAAFSLATLGGYLLSLWIGLYGFKEVRTTAGIAAGVVEVGPPKTSAMQSRQSSSAAWMAGGVMQVRDDLDIIG